MPPGFEYSPASRKPGAHGTCHYCGGHGDTRDHIVPKSRGGKLRADNLVWACQKCNLAKGNKMPWCRCDKCKAALAKYGPAPQAEVVPTQDSNPLLNVVRWAFSASRLGVEFKVSINLSRR